MPHHPLMITLAILLLAGCATKSRETAPKEEPPPPEWMVRADITLKACVLLPAPRRIQLTGGEMTGSAVERLTTDLMACLDMPEPARFVRERNAQLLAASVDPVAMSHGEGYILSIDGVSRVQIKAHDEAGVFRALMTLRQLARLSGGSSLPCLRVEDWPDFAHRGFMLDAARCKVPTMETLRGVINQMAEWKCNELQLYIEHTFAYPGHETVWRDASPFTPEEIRLLDAYCSARHIELVPNQNSFGHMNRWLTHPEYAALAETPDGHDLCPVDPGSIALLDDLYANLLPCFTSGTFNVGCDETFTIGRGRSRAEVKRIGKGRVYLNFLLRIHALAAKHNKKIQFWGDIILGYPELISELPKDVTAMAWGYEANHPFAKQGQLFAASGVPFYVCPGTSSWNAIIGRTDNALANLRNAAVNGLANGAVGYLMTDWGDGGHWQFLPFSYLPFAYGAALSWTREASISSDLFLLMDTHVFQDSGGVMTHAMHDLGSAHQMTGVTLGNKTVFSSLLVSYRERRLSKSPLKGLEASRLRETSAYITSVMERLAFARMGCPDAAQMLAEVTLGAKMARFACDLGVARIEAGGAVPSDLSPETRASLAGVFRPIVDEYRILWLARNRTGGLKESTEPFEELLADLEKTS